MLFMPAIERGVYCMLLWPEHRNTSPNSTSLRESWSVPSVKVSVVPVLVAGVGGSVMRQVELPSTTAESALPERSRDILAPGVPKPHTTADLGAR